MLSKDRFYELFFNPESHDESEVEAVRDLCQKSPQFVAAQMLYLKLLHLNGDFHKNKQLKWASVFAPNRDKLYQYVHDEVPLAEVKPALEFDPETMPETISQKEETISQDSQKQVEQNNPVASENEENPRKVDEPEKANEPNKAALPKADYKSDNNLDKIEKSENDPVETTDKKPIIADAPKEKMPKAKMPEVVKEEAKSKPKVDSIKDKPEKVKSSSNSPTKSVVNKYKSPLKEKLSGENPLAARIAALKAKSVAIISETAALKKGEKPLQSETFKAPQQTELGREESKEEKKSIETPKSKEITKALEIEKEQTSEIFQIEEEPQIQMPDLSEEITKEIPAEESTPKIEIASTNHGEDPKKEEEQAANLVGEKSTQENIPEEELVGVNTEETVSETTGELEEAKSKTEREVERTMDFQTWLQSLRKNNEGVEQVSVPKISAPIEGQRLLPKRREKWQIIDEFLEKMPKIGPPKKSDLNEQKISPVQFSTGIDEDNDLITETLAKIYIEQGYISEAISAYEILQLKTPEKSSLFARQIESLKKQQKK